MTLKEMQRTTAKKNISPAQFRDEYSCNQKRRGSPRKDDKENGTIPRPHEETNGGGDKKKI